jgi:CO/xanthine dehydrogenase Mo-binding subunit
VSVYVGSAQIAADTLGLPLGQVRVLHGSTPFLTLDNFRLSPGQKDFAAPQGVR